MYSQGVPTSPKAQQELQLVERNPGIRGKERGQVFKMHYKCRIKTKGAECHRAEMYDSRGGTVIKHQARIP